MAKRKIICADAVRWLSKHRDLGSIITSLPDKEEVSMSDDDYLHWFPNAAIECLTSTSEDCLTIFYQTDRRKDNALWSKANMIFQAAEVTRNNVKPYKLLWHKIVLRRDVGKTDLRRPGYSHLICFGNGKAKAGVATPDVFESGGMLYSNGMAMNAATVALQAALKHGTKVCDPFCGRGTVPVLAETMGFTRIRGVDIDPEQCNAARTLRLGQKPMVKSSKKRTRLLINDN